MRSDAADKIAAVLLAYGAGDPVSDEDLLEALFYARREQLIRVKQSIRYISRLRGEMVARGALFTAHDAKVVRKNVSELLRLRRECES